MVQNRLIKIPGKHYTKLGYNLRMHANHYTLSWSIVATEHKSPVDITRNRVVDLGLAA
jgi:hypothetical protein